MPNYFPEGNTIKPSDDAGRTLQKWNDLLYQALGNRGPYFFPEGSKPLQSDDEERSMMKINALRSP